MNFCTGRAISSGVVFCVRRFSASYWYVMGCVRAFRRLVSSGVVGKLSAKTGGGKRVKRMKGTAVKRASWMSVRWLGNRRGLR